ncbi:MAG TPA: hypothetical protein DCY75_01970 [Clostridiales bacterium]|nr:hypothetical protein [Clostridiales bacterium]
MENMENSRLSKIVSMNRLTPENCRFSQSSGGFLLMERLGETSEMMGRVILHRAFPFEYPESFLAVMDTEQNELGVIQDVTDFDPETRQFLRCALARRYYMPIIVRIDSIKERFGFSYWKCKTDQGDVSFSVKDTYRSILKVGENRIVITDADGARYDIPDLIHFDKKSFRKIELYL